jgi:hypothetical protein
MKNSFFVTTFKLVKGSFDWCLQVSPLSCKKNHSSLLKTSVLLKKVRSIKRCGLHIEISDCNK